MTYRILFAPASTVLFHVGRCVRIARELSIRGHETILAGLPRYLCDPEIASSALSTYHPLPDFDADEAMVFLRSVVRAPARARVEELIRAEIDALEALKPDVVVCDFRPTIVIAARACGIPVVSLLLSHWLPEYSRRLEWVPRSYPIGVAIERVVGTRLGLRLVQPVFQAAIARKSAPFRRAARSRGQPAPRLLWEHLKGDLTLLTDADEFCALPPPPRCQRVGPVVWAPEAPAPTWLEELDPDRPVVFVNYGSTAHPDLFRRTLEEFAELPYQVLMATCGQVELRPAQVPPNFRVEKFFPVETLVQRADLAVYHGGAGTFYQAARAAVPGVVVATHWDQEYAGFVTEKLGLGLFLTLRDVVGTPGRLTAATRTVLDDLPRHRARARELAQSLLRYDGPKTAADAIEVFLRRGDAEVVAR